MEYNDFKTLFRKRDTSRTKRRTMEVLRFIFNSKKTLERLELELGEGLLLKDLNMNTDELPPETQLQMVQFESVSRMRMLMDEELNRLHPRLKLIKQKIPVAGSP